MTQESPAARRRRLRWLTIGEIVGVLALVIAALGWWDNHRDHAQETADRAAAARHASAADTLVLVGTVQKDGARLRLAPLNPAQVVQTQQVIFPAAVRVQPVETTGDPRIEAGWLADGAAKARGKGDAGDGEARMPVGLVTTYIEDGATRTDQAIYEVAYTVQGRFLLGAKVELTGLSLLHRGGGRDVQPRLDAMWASAHGG